MLGLDSNVAQHHLNISPKAWLAKQRPHKFTIDYQLTIRNKIDKLLGMGFIYKVQYPQWSTNIVLIKKLKVVY